LTAARERFAADGYERATIRAIAAEANIDPAMVMRYFGSKERLFAVAADFDLELPDLRQGPRDQVGSRLAAHFLHRWEDDDEALRILLRVGATNPAVAERIREVFDTQLMPVVAELDGDPKRASMRAGLVSTQLLGVALCRYVLHLPPVTNMSRAEILGSIGPTLQTYLTGNLLDEVSPASRRRTRRASAPRP
jgi:AcrR family transcriptional regulator